VSGIVQRLFLLFRERITIGFAHTKYLTQIYCHIRRVAIVF
jgi:hypothetical protein